MLKRISAIITAGSAAAALSITLGAASSSAATARMTWTVKPGGNFSASGSGQVKDKKTGTVAKCVKITMTGTLKSGSGLPGTGIGTIKSGSFAGCTIATITVMVATKGLPWHLNAISFKNGVTSGTISGLILVATAPGCSATLEGPKAGQPGTVDVSYTNSSGVLKLLGTGGNLTAQNVSGCLGLVNNGDGQAASGSLKVTPKQTIT